LMNEYLDFILDKCPMGLVIFNRKSIFYSNRKANTFLSRFELPAEIPSINKRIYDAIDKGQLGELFPGEICFSRKFKGSPSNWIFRMYINDKPNPVVYLVIVEETISNKIDINQIRQQFRLSRRESDVLRRVLDGLRNIEIADELEISEQTIKDHLSSIYKKIGAENRMGLMRVLIQTPNS
jgi:DNA-binding CsgD family transcriptional regulator